MSVRAKFTVNRIEITIGSMPVEGVFVNGRQKYAPCEMKTIVMGPVYGNGDPTHENTKFWQATPQGEIRLGTINPEASSQFQVGESYFVDFTPA